MNDAATRDHASYQLDIEQGQLVIKPRGRWNLHTARDNDAALKADLLALGYDVVRSPGTKASYEGVIFDFKDLTRIDTAGAFVLTRTLGCHDGFCHVWSVRNCNNGQKVLMQAAAEAVQGMAPPKIKPWYDPLDRLGRGFTRACGEAYDTIAFFGNFFTILLRMLLNPRRIRWKAVVSLVETVGLDAMPIVVILSFFIGCVLAFMGTDILRSFGATVFTVDLVGIAVLREFGVLITAILLAGRSNSAFTAQIGSMKMRQEIDAMTVMGLGVGETIVAPRALACLIAAPILTFAAMMSGLLGGMMVAWSEGISPILFTARMKEVVPVSHFWVGMVKAPVFAMVVAIIGCRQGLAVEGSVESLGSRTTTSVVQAIFSVIVLDAMFAMLFLKMGV